MSIPPNIGKPMTEQKSKREQAVEKIAQIQRIYWCSGLGKDSGDLPERLARDFTELARRMLKELESLGMCFKAQDQIKLRAAVKSFAEAMEMTLRENDHKGGWGEDKCPDKYLEERLLSEVKEYLDSKDVAECVDVANFAMMIYQRGMNSGYDRFMK